MANGFFEFFFNHKKLRNLIFFKCFFGGMNFQKFSGKKPKNLSLRISLKDELLLDAEIRLNPSILDRLVAQCNHATMQPTTMQPCNYSTILLLFGINSNLPILKSKLKMRRRLRRKMWKRDKKNKIDSSLSNFLS